jgi:hypothetical protein
MKPTRITVHCSDTPNNKDIKSETILEWHLARNFTTIGYHAVIHPDGDVDTLANKSFFRGFTTIGAHVRGYNDGNIGICLIGRDRFTLNQFWSLKNVVRKLMLAYRLDEGDVWCHYEMSSKKTCPNVRNGDLICFLITGKKSYIQQYLLEEK